VVWTARCRDGVMSCCWLWLFYAYLSFLVDKQLGCWPQRVIPFRIAADMEKGGASWRQIGLPSQSLPRRRFRRACLRAYIQFVCVSVYVYVCMCADMYIYTYVHVCMYMYMYAFIHMCMCMCMHICA